MPDPPLPDFTAWMLRQIRKFGPYLDAELEQEAELHGEGELVGPALARLEELGLIERDGLEWVGVFREVVVVKEVKQRSLFA